MVNRCIDVRVFFSGGGERGREGGLMGSFRIFGVMVGIP